MRNVMFAVLSLFCFSTALAKGTIIIAYYNPVQCNKWGWVVGNTRTVWDNTCAPLEVKSADGSKVFSIDDTANNRCKDYQKALYRYTEGSTHICFVGCR